MDSQAKSRALHAAPPKFASRERVKKVLIVDSDQDFRKNLVDQVYNEISGVEIKQAANGQEALYVMEHFSVDLLVTELAMPVMDGFELLSYLKQQELRVPVMVITGSPLADIQDILRNLGFYMFHQKSEDNQDLIDRIKDSLLSEVEGSLSGVSMAGFLQLLESERKNCLINVMHNGQHGTLHVVDGAVIDAQLDDMRGEEAAKRIVCWGSVQMFISQGTRFGRNTVNLKLQDLLLQAFVRHDEEQSENGEQRDSA